MVHVTLGPRSTSVARPGRESLAAVAPGGFRRAGIILLDGAGLIGLAFLLPFAIILVGAPVALAIRLVLWLVEAATR